MTESGAEVYYRVFARGCQPLTFSSGKGATRRARAGMHVLPGIFRKGLVMFRKFVFAAVFAVVVSSASFAAEKSVDTSIVPTPLDNVKVGQWVEYKTMGGGKQKQTVTAIEGEGDAQTITIKMELSMGEMTIPPQEVKIAVGEAREIHNGALAEGNITKVAKETISAGGKQYDAVLVESSDNGQVSKLYMSKDIPVTAIVKMELPGLEEPMMEITGFGNN